MEKNKAAILCNGGFIERVEITVKKFNKALSWRK